MSSGIVFLDSHGRSGDPSLVWRVTFRKSCGKRTGKPPQNLHFTPLQHGLVSHWESKHECKNWAQQAETIAHDTSDLSALNGWPVICGRELAEGFSLQPIGNFDQQVPLLSADQRPRGACWVGWPRMAEDVFGWHLQEVGVWRMFNEV